MKIGFIPDRNTSLKEELSYSISLFDFLELSYSEELESCFSLLKDVEIVGHSGEDDISSGIEKSLSFFSKLNVVQYTLHLSDKLTPVEIQEKIDKLEEEYSIPISIENSKQGSYSKYSNLEKIGKGITLDIGHAILSKELDNFLKNKNKITHIHLHGIAKNKLRDHSIPDDSLIYLVKNNFKDKRVLLEIFYDSNGNVMERERRREGLRKIKEKLI